jgi:glucose-1-phosphate thymidylyltransferase
MNVGKKGIVLAGGTGSRLWPLTIVNSKHLLPIYNKPMIYYPLTTLMLAGIREYLLIATESEISRFKRLFGSGNVWGINIQYAVQHEAKGIAEAFLIGASFIKGQECVLILGDNIFYGVGIGDVLQRAMSRASGATIFCHWVKNPSRYGVLEFDSAGRPATIQEKPQDPKSNWAVTGLYIYDRSIVDIARRIRPSARGELEITDVNSVYLEKRSLNVEKLGRGYAWFDAGTQYSLLQASEFIYTIEERQGVMIGCPEEVAYRMGFIDAAQLEQLAATALNAEYGGYLRHLLAAGP